MPSPRRNAESADERAVHAVPLEEARHRPRPAEPLERDHVETRSPSSAAQSPRASTPRRRARCAPPRARAACGRSSGCRSRKKASVSVTRSSAPPAIRSTASPRQTCVEREHQPVDLDPVAALDERSAPRRRRARGRAGRSATSRPRAARPGAAPRRRRRRSALTSWPRPSASNTARPGKLVGPVAEHRPVRDLARRRAARADGVEQRRSSRARRARSRFGVAAASFPVRPPSTSCARSASPSSRKTTIGYSGAEAIPRRVSEELLALDGDRAAEAVEVAGADLVVAT